MPIVGGRARKFEPQAAMQMMADHGMRNVFLPPTALKLMRQADVRHSGVRLRSMLSPAANRSARELLDWVRATFGIDVHEVLRPDRVQSRGRQQFKTVSDPARFDGQGDAGI